MCLRVTYASHRKTTEPAGRMQGAVGCPVSDSKAPGANTARRTSLYSSCASKPKGWTHLHGLSYQAKKHLLSFYKVRLLTNTLKPVKLYVVSCLFH